MAESTQLPNEELDRQYQSSRAAVFFDRETVSPSRKEEEHNPQEVIYISESTETPDKPPNLRVKEAYVQTASENVRATDKPAAGIFSKIAGTVQSIFRWRKMPIKTTRITPDSGSNFLDAERVEVTQDQSRNTDTRTNSLQMNQLSLKHEKSDSQIQPTLNHSFQSGFLNNESKTFARNEQCSTFESKIYSVNSAGKPIPLTIENDKNDETSEESSSELSENTNEDGSQVRLHSNRKEKSTLKEYLIKTWQRTHHPNSLFMYCWLLLISVIVLYNAWIIPLRATFITDIQTPLQGLWFSIDALCDTCFIIDILVKFRTRFLKHGVYITDISTLNYHHTREWTLFLDVVAVFPTDLFFIQSINPYLRLNRVLKVYRAFSFYRMVEIKTWWPNLLRITNLIHTVAIILHYNACIYYSSCLATGFGSTLTSWAYPNPSIYTDYYPLTRRYTHSFYWSLQELTLIGGRPQPEQDWQYVYNIYLNLVGIGLAAYVIGYVTMLLLGKNSEKFEFERSMETTRKYMKKRKLPKELRRRVEEFYDYTWNKSEFSHLDEEKMLRHLPISIKEEIAYHGNYNALKELPQLSHCDTNILKSLVSKLKRRTYLPGQFVYKSGDAGTEMYIVNEGVLQIIRERDGQVTGASEGDIFGEMNIFNLRKNHRRTSDVVSCGYSELYVLTADDAHETLAQYPRTMNVILQQAKREKTWLRRKMSQNFYKRQSHRRYFPSNSSNESIKLMNSPSNIHLSLKSNSSDATRTAGPSTASNSASKAVNDSPDSGMPSSRKRSEAELSGISGLQNEITDSTLPPELATKLIGIYQKNLKSFQKSLDDIWYNEYISLKQQLSNTETERDDKAREVSRLRHRVVVKKQTKATTKGRNLTESSQKLSKANSEQKGKTKEKTDNQKWQSYSKFRPSTNAARKRTILPTLAGSTDSLNTVPKAESVT